MATQRQVEPPKALDAIEQTIVECPDCGFRMSGMTLHAVNEHLKDHLAYDGQEKDARP